MAWALGPKMAKAEEDTAIGEITKFIAGFKQHKPAPEIILLPELSVPQGFLPSLRNMARNLCSIIIAGLDYRHSGVSEVANEAVIIIPDRWRNKKISTHSSVRHIGKTYCSNQEGQFLSKHGYTFHGDNSIWLFDGGDIGRFGVVICYDFLDLERVAAYREQVQHLFVIAYNRDTRSFEHAAEAMSRMIFCNVVVCNAGFYGGSLAVSPFYNPQQRTIYQHCGPNLITSQVISLPVRELWEHQHSFPIFNSTAAATKPLFKGLPAGYGSPATAVVKTSST
jgi:predicted amidohydrolase